MDTNDSGDIDLPEFLLLMAKRMADSNIEDDINEAFKVINTDFSILDIRAGMHNIRPAGQSWPA
jgi:hypothetical protein